MLHREPAIKFVFFTILLDVLGFGLLIPVAPRLIEQLQGGGAASALVLTGPEGADAAGAAAMPPAQVAPLAGVAAASAPATGEDAVRVRAAGTYGTLIATYAAMQFLFAPVLGSLADRYGRRPVILISLLGSGIDYFAQALAPTLTILFITRALNGVSGANLTACNAYIADVTPPEKRAAAYGMVGAAFGLGFIIGPLLGGVLGARDIHLPFFVAGGLTLLNWLYGYFVLPESLTPERRRPFRFGRANPLGTFAHLARYPLVLSLAGSMFLLNLAMFGLHATWVLYTAHRYDWDETRTGLSLALVGVGAAVVQGGLARKIIPWLGEPRSLLVGIGIGVAAYVGYGLATEGWMVYAIIVVASLGGIAGPAIQALITKSVLPTEQGEVQGALTSLQSVANIAGPLIGSQAFAYFISARAPVYMPGAPYFVSAGLALLGLLVAVWALARHAAPGRSEQLVG